MIEHVNILWTGGWDSTFQLLRLLLVQKRTVQPLYLIDAERPSTGKELLTMRQIKKRILTDYPHTRELILPGRFYAVEDLAPDAEITAAYKAICKQHHMGIQYDWFARLCRQHDLANIQMGIQGGGHIHRILNPFISENEDGFLIGPEHKGADEYTLFHRLNFPIINRTKLQMANFAKEQNWEAIMNMTWFCFFPKSNGTPCGRCNPCRYAIEQGMAWRIPVENLKSPPSLRARVVRRVKKLLRR